MILAVASGKGGTGKTTVAVSLAKVAGAGTRLLDCDVEEPNDHLFLHGTVTGRKTVSIPIPQVDASLCDGCGECGRFCEYHAIVSFGETPLVFPEMCHGCGGCMKICPRHAIRETDKHIGFVEQSICGEIELVRGELDIGAAMAPPLIRAVKSFAGNGCMTILDAPPGTSCPVIAAVRGVDGIILVTEPTPFGLHDLKLAVDMLRMLDIPAGVVINRADAGDDRVKLFCERENIPVLAEIPDDRRIAEAYSRGIPVVEALPEYRSLFGELLEKAVKMNREYSLGK